MSKTRLLALWPCHSWEDFPADLSGSSAASLLACWTALWHPHLISRFESTPGFWRVDRIEEIPPGACVAVPRFAHGKLDQAAWDKLKADAELVVGGNNRDELMGQLGVQPNAGETAGDVGDFFSLGFCWLLLHLMTRQIRYAGSLDEGSFRDSLLAAAKAFQSDPVSPDVRAGLQRCFDLLLEERNRFYPSEASLYRIVIARPVIDASLLAAELAVDGPVNVLATAADLLELEKTAPEVLQTLREKREKGQLAIVSPGLLEIPTLQSHSATAIRNVAEGQRQFQRLTGAGCEVFARRSSGLSPVDPEMAAGLGFRLALHSAFDSIPAPGMSAPNALWQSPGGDNIPVIAGKPLDAGRAECLLRLGMASGEMIDSWHYAHLLLGHWPGHQLAYFEDLVRSMRFGNLLGRFRLLSKTVETLATQTWGETLEADDYDFRPLLEPGETARQQASALRTYWRQTLECLQLKKAATLLALVDPVYEPFVEQLEDVASRIDPTLGNGGSARDTNDSIDQELDSIRSTMSGTGNPEFLVHGSNHPAVVTLTLPARPAESGAGPSPVDFEATGKTDSIRIVHRNPDEVRLVVRAAAAGAIRLETQDHAAATATLRGRQPRMVDGFSLRNELLSVNINPKTGAIAAIQRAGKRGSVASQRLAVRMPQKVRGGQSGRYATMQADSVELVETGRVSASCLARGRLVWQDRTLAEFEQQVSLSREQAFVTIDIRIVPLEKPGEGLWTSCVCSRLAWVDEMANRFRYLQEARTRCCREFFSSPLCTEIETGNDRITLFTGGNAWHRQSALNIMDTLLPEPDGDLAAESYRLGIGLDVDHPLERAVELLTRPLAIARPETFPENDFRIVGWSPSSLHWFDAGRLQGPEQAGWAFRFRESQGQPGSMGVRFARPPDRVELQDFAGKRVGTLQVVDGRIEFAYRAWQYLALAVYWNP